MFRETQSGFSLVAAIFLLVVLALLGALIASVTGMQQASGQFDLRGVRAYHSARAGMEWAAIQVIDPSGATPQPNCSAIDDLVMPSCPVAAVPALGGSLSEFTVTVTCNVTADTTESNNRKLRVFQVVASACSHPSSGICPNPAPPTGYVSRELQA